MKIVTLIFMILNLSPVIANEEILCSTRVLTSVCGSGKIEIAINLKTESYDLLHGDVMCWFSDFNIQGKVKKTVKPNHLFSDYAFELKSEKSSLGNIYIKFKSDNQNEEYYPNLAKLEIKANDLMLSQGAMSGTYNLECK